MKISALGISAAALAAAGTFLIMQPAFAQPPGPPPGAPAGGPPPGGPSGPPPYSAQKDPAVAPVGIYNIDPEHHAIIARVNHMGLSISVVRFGATKGVLNWNPTKPEAITLDVTVSAKTYHDPIQYLIQPESILKTDKFPEMRFVSTAVHKTGPLTADVQGNLTFQGVTKPAVIHAEFIGAGATKDGSRASVGFTGAMDVNWEDFAGKGGISMGLVKIGLDAEFHKK
jgi:polyisoprenoid-binding protein YceI